MTEFEKVLEECLRELEQGTASVDDCLVRHPKHAVQLAPLLPASTHLARARELPVSDDFKSRLRSKLVQEMQAHPRKTVRSNPVLMRLAMGMAVSLLAFLATGTAYAQSTLPGSAFYAWKLASEHAWRAVSVDPLGIDLVIAHRRADELIAVRNNPTLYPRALRTYLDTTTRLKSETDPVNQARILPVLDSQIEQLKKLGILLSQTNKPAPVPAITTTPAMETPPVHSTGLPQILPTVEVPQPIH